MSNSTTPAHIAASFTEWKPETHREKVLVQSIADTEWRLLRIPALESGIYALGRIQFADQFADQPESIRSALLDAFIFQNSRRDLMNLNLQQSRLSRQREKDIDELEDIQDERVAERERRLDAAADMYKRLKKQGDPFAPAEFGFDFSIDEIERHIGQFAQFRAGQLREDRQAA